MYYVTIKLAMSVYCDVLCVVLAVIVASHIRLRALITVLHRDAEHRGEGRDDHRSRPDV